MNCKEGDLAIVVRGLDGSSSQHTGKIVRVVSIFKPRSYLGLIWNVEFSRPMRTVATTSKGTIIGEGNVTRNLQCPDDWLRPLPGEIVDTETEIFAPRKEPVPA